MLNSQRLARHPALAAPWRWAVLGALVGLAIAVLMYAPATWLAAALHEASAGRVQLIEPEAPSGQARPGCSSRAARAAATPRYCPAR